MTFIMSIAEDIYTYIYVYRMVIVRMTDGYMLEWSMVNAYRYVALLNSLEIYYSQVEIVNEWENE